MSYSAAKETLIDVIISVSNYHIHGNLLDKLNFCLSNSEYYYVVKTKGWCDHIYIINDKLFDNDKKFDCYSFFSNQYTNCLKFLKKEKFNKIINHRKSLNMKTSPILLPVSLIKNIIEVSNFI